MKKEVCQICRRPLIGVSKGYRSFRVCGEDCYQEWCRRTKAKVKREMNAFFGGFDWRRVL